MNVGEGFDSKVAEFFNGGIFKGPASPLEAFSLVRSIYDLNKP